MQKRFEEVENAHGHDKYKAMFDKLDRDGSGALDLDELRKVPSDVRTLYLALTPARQALQGLGVVLTDHNQALIMGRVDRDGSGTIDFPEFQYALRLISVQVHASP